MVVRPEGIHTPMTVCLNAGYNRDNCITIKVRNAGYESKTIIEMNISQAKKLIRQLQSVVEVLDGEKE